MLSIPLTNSLLCLMGCVMRAKLLNPLQDEMKYLVGRVSDLLVDNSNSANYDKIRYWFSECVLGYALTVASGNDTYIKGNKTVFDELIVPMCENQTRCSDISICLNDMINLLTR